MGDGDTCGAQKAIGGDTLETQEGVRGIFPFGDWTQLLNGLLVPLYVRGQDGIIVDQVLVVKDNDSRAAGALCSIQNMIISRDPRLK